MVKNNIEVDVKIKCIEAGMTQAQLGEAIGTKGASGYGPLDQAYEDGHREKTNYYCPSECFVEWFRVIKRMLPACEYTPVVLLTNEDYEQEE